MGRGAPAWAQVKLRVAHGEVPPFGAVLVMSTGRRYQVIGVKGRSLQVLVLPPDAEVEPGTPVWSWAWVKRAKKPQRSG